MQEKTIRKKKKKKKKKKNNELHYKLTNQTQNL